MPFGQHEALGFLIKCLVLFQGHMCNFPPLEACLVMTPASVKALQWFSTLFHLLLTEVQDGDRVENVVPILWVRE